MKYALKAAFLAALMFFVALSPPVASANSIIVTYVSTTLIGPSDYDYIYQVELNPDSRINSVLDLNFFTINDFDGYVSASVASLFAGGGSWAVSTALTGLNAPGTAPADNPSLLNVKFAYTGPAIDGYKDLGTVTLKSTYGPTTMPIQYSGRDEKISNLTPQSNLGDTIGPSSVPEPSTLLFTGIGAAFLFAGKRWRKKPGVSS